MLPGCGEGLIVGGLLGLGVAASTGSPEAIAGGALLGEFTYFYVVGPDEWDDTFFFQQVMNGGGTDGGRVALADGARRSSHVQVREPRLTVGPTGCKLSYRF